MNIKIICVGKIKDEYLRNGIAQLIRNINKHHYIEIVEVPDEQAPDNASDKEMQKIKEHEGKKILNKIPDNYHIIALTLDGKEVTTNELGKNLYLQNNTVFLIGGSLGLSEQVIKKSKAKYCFSKMTFTHQLMRLILLEQIDIAIKN